MALTGIDIFKLLPKTNCKDCGVPTCLAFAMKVAGKQASLDNCPHVSDEAKATLGAASEPPQRTVAIGAGDNELSVGGETVIFRHEERFRNPCAVALLVNSDQDDVEAKAKEISALKFTRMGSEIKIDAVAVEGEDAGKLTRAAKSLDAALGLPLVLLSKQAATLKDAAEAVKDKKPLLFATEDNEAAVDLAKELSCSVVASGELEAVATLTESSAGKDVKSVFISPPVGATPASVVDFLTQSRRAALKKAFRPLGCPVIVRATSDDPAGQVLEASSYILKFAGIVIVSVSTPEYVLPILTTRQDIYTDPQKPTQVEAKIYGINDPDKNSPVLITTNFSLSYYSVESEVEASRVPTWIVSVGTEGTSVLTAWAADKFNAESIAAALKATDLPAGFDASSVAVVLPGYVAMLAAGVEDEAKVKVIVGPRESSGISSFLKNDWAKLVKGE